MKRRILPLVTAAMLLTGCAGRAQPSDPHSELHKEMTLTVLKAGKADAMVLQTAGHTVVIDCGEKSDGKKVVAFLEEQGITQIDAMILTHYDQDHIGGAAKVLRSFPVQQVIAADYTEESGEHEKLCAAMDEQGLSFTLPHAPLTLTFDDVDLTILPCLADTYQDGDDNNHSLVTRVVHHSQVLLLTGDAMDERLSEIMDIGDCDLLKIPYHGRDLENLDAFLDAVTPEYAVICTDAGNLSADVLASLDARNVQTYVTYRDGTVTAVSDGDSLSISAAPPADA